MNNEQSNSSLLINSPFALRQWNGVPVLTSIETETAPLSPFAMQCFDKPIKEGRVRPYCKKRVKIDHPLDLYNLERIIVTPNAKGYISTAFFEFAKKHSIPIYWIDANSTIEACFMPVYFKRPSLIIKQCESKINGKNIDIAKYLIKLKLESQGMEHLIPKLRRAKNIKDVLQVEGNASRAYYQQWEFNNEWRWDGRHGRTSINANAIDPINSVLNLGYTLLAQRMGEILLKRGFELTIGFMHNSETSKTYWNMLAFDFVEPYRVWIDSTTREMIVEKKIKPKDFTFSEDKSQIVLKEKTLTIALHRFIDTLEPLEHKSLPLIREIENML
jgi:CRISPR-associated endonuclease Cas1